MAMSLHDFALNQKWLVEIAEVANGNSSHSDCFIIVGYLGKSQPEVASRDSSHSDY